jgi:hypothetical protein
MQCRSLPQTRRCAHSVVQLCLVRALHAAAAAHALGGVVKAEAWLSLASTPLALQLSLARPLPARRC